MDNLNEVVSNGKETKFSFFVKINEGEIKPMTLPLEKKQAFRNRFGDEIPSIAEFTDWLSNNQ